MAGNRDLLAAKKVEKLRTGMGPCMRGETVMSFEAQRYEALKFSELFKEFLLLTVEYEELKENAEEIFEVENRMKELATYMEGILSGWGEPSEWERLDRFLSLMECWIQ